MNKNKKTPVVPPRDFETLRAQIVDSQNSLPKRLVQVAKYAMLCPDEIAFGTTTSIAGAAGVQPSTIVRLAHQLGYEGFSDFQNVFRERLRGRPISYADRFKALDERNVDGSEERVLLNGFLDAAKQSIDNIEANIDVETFRQAVELLAKARILYLVAKRRSYPLIAHMAYTFGRLKIPYQIVGSAIGNDDTLIEMATPQDAAIAISFSPYAAETITHVQSLEKNGVPLVAITDSAFSPLATFSTLWFEVVEADFAGFRSLSASIALSAALPIAIAKKRRSPGDHEG